MATRASLYLDPADHALLVDEANRVAAAPRHEGATDWPPGSPEVGRNQPGGQTGHSAVIDVTYVDQIRRLFVDSQLALVGPVDSVPGRAAIS